MKPISPASHRDSQYKRGGIEGGEIGVKKKGEYRVNRSFCEKLVALLNHGTNPLMDIFRADKHMKMRIVIDYNPQVEKIKVTYYEEDIC